MLDKNTPNGTKVIYEPTDGEGNIYKTEPGVLKRFNADKTTAFVWYHSGCTAAGTRLEDLRVGEMRGTELVHTGCHSCCNITYK